MSMVNKSIDPGKLLLIFFSNNGDSFYVHIRWSLGKSRVREREELIAPPSRHFHMTCILIVHSALPISAPEISVLWSNIIFRIFLIKITSAGRLFFEDNAPLSLKSRTC